MKMKNNPFKKLSGAILVVDDEPMILQMFSFLLEEVGCRATVCSDPRKALAIFRQAPQTFDLVLTDQSMPELSGLELARELLAISPGLPIILLSGHADLTDKKEILAAGIKEVLAKPVATAVLLETLNRFLPPAP